MSLSNEIKCYCPICDSVLTENMAYFDKFFFCPKCRTEITNPVFKWEELHDDHPAGCTCMNCSWC